MTEPEVTLPTSDCTICMHAQSAEIDTALLNGTAQRAIAETFGVSRSSVNRHKLRHLSVDEALKGADDGRVERSAELRIVDVHGGLSKLAVRLEHVVELATRTRKATAAVAAFRELRQTLEAIAKIQADPELQRAASRDRLETWLVGQGTETIVRMLVYAIQQFFGDYRSGSNQSLDRAVGQIMAGSLRVMHRDGVDASFKGVDASLARAFVEDRALEDARRMDAEVQRRVKAELRRREAQARPAIDVAPARLAIEGGASWLS